MAKDEREAPLSDNERILRRLLDQAVLCGWVDHDGGRKLVFEHALRLQEFFETMMRQGDKGFDLGAHLFLDTVTRQALPRPVRSHLLRRLARALHDIASGAPEVDTNGVSATYGVTNITDSEVAGFGRFLICLLVDQPEMVVEWAEDMDTEDPLLDMHPQPTALIRGALFSARVDIKRCLQFWEMAAASKTFPLRIFSDPCLSTEGIVFSPFQVRRVALLLSLVTLGSALRFASHIRTHAVRKMIRESLGSGVFQQTPTAASQQEINAALTLLAGSVTDKLRQQKVTEALGLPAVA